MSTNTKMENWRKQFEKVYPLSSEYDIKQFIVDLLIEICSKAESMETAREVRHLIKDYILK